MSSDPGPLSKPPRSAMTMRHLVGALVVLVAIVLVAGGLSGSFTFAPTGPVVDSSQLPVVDAPAELTRMAPELPFPVRVPAVPADWRANVVDRAPVGDPGQPAVRTGYLTPDGRYLRLQQSAATEETLLAAEAGAAVPTAQGTVDVDGRQWVVYRGERDEQIWIADVAGDRGSVRLLVTGSGSDADFHTLAAAAASGVVAPAQR